ncbi:NAD(P)H-binding protein [Streptomyces sp. NPDC051684]|uniref:NAD(P)H-binding protein n=1 Tax=Streptomyces sp. NPDC051684 TaxID=3365670 RepID=UPI0037BB9D7D
MILVTGATGVAGREVLAALSGHPVRALVRDPAKARALPPGAEAAIGDYADGASLRAALQGVTSAFLVTNRVTHDDDGAFLAAAREAGVRRVVKLSAASVTDAEAVDAITRWQRATEEALRASGLGWTVLRPRAFMSNTLAWTSEVRTGRTVRVLAPTGRNACVDPRDIAEVAALALTRDGHDRRAYTLTGPRPLTPVEQAAELASQLGRPVAVEELPAADARERWGRRHPGPVVEALIESASRQGRDAKVAVDPALPTLLARPARSYRTWVADHLDAFRAT